MAACSGLQYRLMFGTIVLSKCFFIPLAVRGPKSWNTQTIDCSKLKQLGPTGLGPSRAGIGFLYLLFSC